jgi:hypothetical protein
MSDASASATTAADSVASTPAIETSAPAFAPEPARAEIDEPLFAKTSPLENRAEEEAAQPAAPVVEAKPEPKAEATAEPKEDAKFVGLRNAMIEERKQRQALEQQNAEMRGFLLAQQQAAQRQTAPQQAPQQQIPDPLSDPVGYQQFLMNAVQQTVAQETAKVHSQAQEMRFHGLQQATAQQYGDVAVREAFEWVGQLGPEARAYYSGKANPYAEAINDMRAAKVRQEVGTDLSAYQDKLLSDPAFLSKAAAKLGVKAGSPAPAVIPPSLSSMTRAGGNTTTSSRGEERFNSFLGG